MKQDKNNTKQPGFKVPKDYFENFEDVIMSEVSLKEKVGDAGFITPVSYFDTLDDRIMTKIDRSGKVFSLINKKSLFYISGVAAALILFFSLGDFGSKTTYDTLSIETVEDYIISEDLDSYELAELFNDSEMSDEFLETIDITEEAIEDYVDDYIQLEDLYTE